MRNKARRLSSYTFTPGEHLLLDANIWLFLFPAPSDKLPGYAANYSSSFKLMLQTKVDLILDALILSEYLNRYCRIEWKALHKAVYPEFKDFRRSPEFTAVGKGAALYARGILKLCTRQDHPFTAANLDQVLTDFETSACDFNDGLLVETCRNHDWKLVTNDRDFVNGGIEILTNNPMLLKACS